MFLYAEERRLPRINLVAFRAFAVFGPSIELTVVNVLVTILAICESERLFEIATGVAGNAGNLRVTAQEREFCFRMIEFEL